MNKCIEDLSFRAKRALMAVNNNVKKINVFDPAVYFKLFDTQIAPILLYGSEVWGVKRYDAIESVHLVACKTFLNVGLQTPNVIVYGECGRYPLYIKALVRAIKYWLKLTEMHSDMIHKKAYDMLLYYDNCGYDNYASHVRTLLFSHGFGFVWISQCVGNKLLFLNSLKKCSH